MLELSHKKLIAWQKAITMLPLVSSVCQKLQPGERFNLVDQMTRAALSVSNNLAEGSSRKTKAEKNRFFEISRSSVVEIDNCLVACLALEFLTVKDVTVLAEALVEEFKLITGLIVSNNR